MASQAPDPESLEELLRHCHRDELLPLCQALRIRPDGLGLGTLATVAAATLRRRGGNDVANLVLRAGDGPSYDTVLRGLSTRCGVAAPPPAGTAATASPAPTVEELELAIVGWSMGLAWPALTDEQRAAMWSKLDLPPPVPSAGDPAVRLAETALEGRYGYAASAAALGVASRIVPLAGCLAMLWLTRPDDAVLVPAVLHVARVRQIVRHRVTVGLVGSPSSGKDAAIRALFGVDSGNIHPIAGSTREVAITRLPGATALYVVNTPGLGDVVERVTEEARQVLHHIDVYLYLVNAQGGVQQRERADYLRCRETGRPVLAVLNKIDTLRAEDRERFVEDTRRKLGADATVVAAAFDPLPQLSPEPIGVDLVRQWIRARLTELGKDPAELRA